MKTTLERELPDSEVKIKISMCQKCNGIVRTAVSHKLTTKSKNEFLKEVMEYNLSIKEIPLLEYQDTVFTWCKCD